MILGYNTNGFAHHRLNDAITILAELGYGGIGLTLDVHHLDPFLDDGEDSLNALLDCLMQYRLRSVIETGARFLLDPRRKHQPTLLDGDFKQRAIRMNFLEKSIYFAAQMRSDAVSFWSGTATTDTPRAVLFSRLVEACKRLADYAASSNVRLAFEPEPGMLIETMEQFAELQAAVNHPAFGLTLDIGHLVCMGEVPVATHIRAWQHKLWNIHIEDMKPGVHDHLMFGEGEVNFTEVFTTLKEINYRGLVQVELSRHSHDAVRTAERSLKFLENHLK